MNLAVKISLLFSGLFLLAGMLAGVWKYREMMKSKTHEAPVYVDIAHRASLLYAFASLVIAKLLEYSPFSVSIQIFIALLPIAYFTLTIIGYLKLGWQRVEITQFSERNFITTWFMYSLIAAEIGGVALIVGGFIYTQFVV